MSHLHLPAALPLASRGSLSAPAERLAEVHLFQRLGRHFLFNVESLLCYQVTPEVAAAVAALLGEGDDAGARLSPRCRSRRAIQHVLAHLRQEGVLRPADDPIPRPRLARRCGIRHLELMVTHACNLRCRYCYGSEIGAGSRHLYGADEDEMPFEVAQRGVDFLFASCGGARELSLIFFGGEPLLALDLIRRVVPEVRRRERTTGTRVSLSLSTNGVGLTEEVVDELVANRIGCQVSIDGPPEIQDANRPFPSGQGSYRRILPGLRRLLAARPGRVTARVTAAHGSIRLLEVVEHLLSLGFGAVHVEPAVGSCAGAAVTPEDVTAMQEQTEELARLLADRVRRDRTFAYHNLVRFIRQTRVVRQRLAHHCGAARTYLALARDGAFYPCHRFVGMPEYRMGDVWSGFDDALQRRILALTVDERPGCRECWARYLCGGGCWKHAVDAHGGLERPDEGLTCALIRHQIECALAVNAELEVSDSEVLSQRWEQDAAPYLVPEREGDHVSP